MSCMCNPPVLCSCGDVLSCGAACGRCGGSLEHVSKHDHALRLARPAKVMQDIEWLRQSCQGYGAVMISNEDARALVAAWDESQQVLRDLGVR